MLYIKHSTILILMEVIQNDLVNTNTSKKQCLKAYDKAVSKLRLL